jgi:DNA-binding CsgD family transcriptional regulator
MARAIRAEEIYDAATDDAAFERLAAAFAEAVDARSGVIHWRDFSEQTEQVSYSGYFSDEQMADYERHFAEDDLWSDAVNRPERLGRVWDCSGIVSPQAYENGRIYNEWIRPMGDDTFHCLGGALRTETVSGDIGFHRGRGQPAFDEAAVRVVEDGLVHLRRMVAIRSKLVAARRLTAQASASLDIFGHGILTLDTAGRLIHCNLAAEAILRGGDGLAVHARRLVAREPGDQSALQAALDRALAPDRPEAGGVLVQRSLGRPYELSILSTAADGQRQIVIVVTDPSNRNAGLHDRLRGLYALTAAEAEVAELLARGWPPRRIADHRGVSTDTIHSQLKAIFSKLGCRRQSELVAMISGLPQLLSMADGEAAVAGSDGSEVDED